MAGGKTRDGQAEKEELAPGSQSCAAPGQHLRAVPPGQLSCGVMQWSHGVDTGAANDSNPVL